MTIPSAKDTLNTLTILWKLKDNGLYQSLIMAIDSNLMHLIAYLLSLPHDQALYYTPSSSVLGVPIGLAKAGEWSNAKLVDMLGGDLLARAVLTGSINMVRMLLDYASETTTISEKSDAKLLADARIRAVKFAVVDSRCLLDIIKLLVLPMKVGTTKLPNPLVKDGGLHDIFYSEDILRHACLPVVKFLIEQKADIVGDEDEEPVLHAAYTGRNDLLINKLPSNISKYQYLNPDRHAPIYGAVGNGHIDTVRYLLEMKSDVRPYSMGLLDSINTLSEGNMRNRRNADQAADILELLLKPPGEQDAINLSAYPEMLSYAVTNGDTALVQVLLSAKASAKGLDSIIPNRISDTMRTLLKDYGYDV